MFSSAFFVAFRNTLIALTVGAAGGTVFYLLHGPLPWTLGSLFATATMAILGGRWFLPTFAWSFARPFVGVLAGSAFTLPVLMALPGWWDVLVALTLYSAVITLLGWMFFTRICGHDDVTAFFASAPGGLGELTLLGGSLGGQVRTLVLIHAVRIVIVVFTVPFVVQFFLLPQGTLMGAASRHAAAGLSPLDWLMMTACGVLGFFLGKRFRSFGGVMLVPMLLSAAIHVVGLTSVSPPYWLVAFVQIVIGSISGARFANTHWAELKTTAVYGFLWAIVVTGGAFLAAWLCTFFTDLPILALVMAFSPGGIVEITIIAYAIGIEVAFIVTCQIARTTLVLLVTPALFRVTQKVMPGSDRDRFTD